jgi:hypothetical protein
MASPDFYVVAVTRMQIFTTVYVVRRLVSRRRRRFECEKLLNAANQVDPFRVVKTDISKIVTFLGLIL